MTTTRQLPISSEINTLLRVVTHLRRTDKEMPMSRLQVLLLVAKAGEEGALVRDIVKASGIVQSTVARSLAHLEDTKVRGNTEPLGLVRTFPDPEDPRRVRCVLTDKGKTLLSDIENLM